MQLFVAPNPYMNLPFIVDCLKSFNFCRDVDRGGQETIHGLDCSYAYNYRVPCTEADTAKTAKFS